MLHSRLTLFVMAIIAALAVGIFASLGLSSRPPNLVFDDVGQEGKLLTFYVGETGEAYSIRKIEKSVKGKAFVAAKDETTSLPIAAN